MMDYTILTKRKVNYDPVEELTAEQDELLAQLGLDWHEEKEIHFFNSAFFDEQTEKMSLYEAVECLAIKDGVDLVRFSNGNIGFVAYYNGNKNGCEVIG